MSSEEAIRDCFTSWNVCDANLEPANVVDTIDKLSRGCLAIASALKRPNAAEGTDETGGSIDSLTESVMGTTAALCRISESIQSVADSIYELSSVIKLKK